MEQFCSHSSARYHAPTFPPSPPILPPDPLTSWFSSLPLPAQTDHLVSSLLSAANVSFSRKPASIRKPYLSVSTQQEISNLTSGTLNASDVATLRRQIRSHAARDKKRWTLRQLDIDHRSSRADRWKTIKRVRSKYQPRTQSVCWPSGRPSTAAEKPEVLAQYLKDTVWKPSSCPPPSLARLFPCLDAAFAPFTMVDIKFALLRLKSRKAPGPYQVSISSLMRCAASSLNTSTAASFLPLLRIIGNWQGSLWYSKAEVKIAACRHHTGPLALPTPCINWMQLSFRHGWPIILMTVSVTFSMGFVKRGPRVHLSSLSAAWLNSLNSIPHLFTSCS